MKTDDWLWGVFFIVFMFWLFTRSTTEGSYESNSIACAKPADGGKWRNAVTGANRWGAVFETDYQVSFAHQRVVTKLPAALQECTVFDRENWACGDQLSVNDGDMSPACSDILGPECRLALDWITHPLVYIGGANWMCGIQSGTLDAWYEGSQRLRGYEPKPID